MHKPCRMISIVLLLSFLFNTTAYNEQAYLNNGPVSTSSSFGNPVSDRPIIDELAAGSMCNEILGWANKDKGNLKIVIEAGLMHCADAAEQEEISLKSLLRHINKKENVKKYRNSIFDRTHVYFSEIEKERDFSEGRIPVMCRIKDERKKKKEKRPPVRTYYAVFSTKRDLDNGFGVKIYTEEEWAEKREESFKDTLAIERYIENKRTISEFIAERIAKNDFTEIEGRAESLRWNDKEAGYPDRINPTKYLPERVWEYIKREGIDGFLAGFGTSLDRVLKKKNIVFIRVPRGKKLPPIREAGQNVSVDTHASENAVYIFLEEEHFNILYGLSMEAPSREKAVNSELYKTRYVIQKEVVSKLVHGIGKLHNLDVFLNKRKTRVRNALDEAWHEFQQMVKNRDINLSEDDAFDSAAKIFKEHYVRSLMERFPDLKKLKDGPVNLDMNLRERVYGGGFTGSKWFKKIPFISSRVFQKDRKALEFIRETGCFTTDELKRLVEAYGDEKPYKKALSDFNEQINRDEYEKYQSVFVRFKKMLEGMGIKVESMSSIDRRPKIDKIGGIDTLRNALSLRQSIAELTGASTMYVKEYTGEFNPLPDNELKTVALLQEDIKKAVLEIGTFALETQLECNLFGYVITGNKDYKDSYEKIAMEHKLSESYSLEEIYDMVVRKNFSAIVLALRDARQRTVVRDYGDNVFHFHDTTVDSDNMTLFIPCSRDKTTGKSGKQYYAMVDFRREAETHVRILTQEEAGLIRKMNGYGMANHFKRSAEDMERIEEYLLHEQRIDKLAGDVLRRRKGTGGFYLVPENSYLIENVRIIIMSAFSRISGKRHGTYEKLAKRLISAPYTLINVGKESNLPRMSVKIKGKKEKKEVIVRMHTGPREKYIFLTEEEYNKFNKLDDKTSIEDMEQDIIRWMIHDAGEASLGLSVIGVHEGHIMNELDYACEGLDLEGNPIVVKADKDYQAKLHGRYSETFTTLKKILEADDPIVNINDLRGTNAAGERYERLFTAGNVNQAVYDQRRFWREVYGNNDLTTLKNREEVINTGDPSLFVSKKNKDIPANRLIAEHLVREWKNSGIEPLLKLRIKFLEEKQRYEVLVKKDEQIRGYWKKLDEIDDLSVLEALLKVLEHGNQWEYTEKEREAINRYGSNPVDFYPFQQELKKNEAGILLRYKIACLKRKEAHKALEIISEKKDIENGQLAEAVFDAKGEYRKSGKKGEKVLKYWEELGKIKDLLRLETLLKVLEYGGNTKYSPQELAAINEKGMELEGLGKLQQELKENNTGVFLEYKIACLKEEKEALKTAEEEKDAENGRLAQAVLAKGQEWAHNEGNLEILRKAEKIEKLGTCRRILEIMKSTGPVQFQSGDIDILRGVLGLIDLANARERLNSIRAGLEPLLEYKIMFLKKNLGWNHAMKNNLRAEVKTINDLPRLEALLRIMEAPEGSFPREDDWNLFWGTFDMEDFQVLRKMEDLKEYVKDNIRLLKEAKGSKITTPIEEEKEINEFLDSPDENLSVTLNPLVRQRTDHLRHKREEKEKTLARQTGIICSKPETDHILFVLNDFVSGSEDDESSEFGSDIADYRSRFSIKKIRTDRPDEIVGSILHDIEDEGFKPENVIVQLPMIFSKEKNEYASQIDELKKQAPGIEFIIVDPAGIKNIGMSHERKIYRRRIYSIMRLIRKMGQCRDNAEELQVAEFLEYLLAESFLKDIEGKTVPAKKYIETFKKKDMPSIMDIILSCMPVKPHPSPNYRENVKIFTFA